MEHPVKKGEVCMVFGTQWGDEGKGKLVDILAGECDIVARCQGGNNAGHTIVVGDVSYDFHLVPSGIIHEGCTSLIGNGVVLNAKELFDELEKNETKGLRGWANRLKISDRAHLVFKLHMDADGYNEKEKDDKGTGSLGTTKKGIGPTYSSKMQRINLRVCDLIGDWNSFTAKFKTLAEFTLKSYPNMIINVDDELAKLNMLRDRLRPMVTDTVVLLYNAVSSGNKRVLIEGANAQMLDIDFGTYPYVTSSNCSVGGACTGLGLPPSKLDKVFGVVKAYTTRVGAGDFPTEQLNAIGEALQSIGHEVGVTTGRKRRCGWLDLVVVRYTHMINNLTSIMLTKLDCLDTFKEIKIGVKYKINGHYVDGYPANVEDLAEVEVEYITLPGWESDISKVREFKDLPPNCKAYVKKIEEILGVPVQWIGVGPKRDSTIRIF